MGFFDIFTKQKEKKFSKWKELGAYTAVFSVFGNDAYKSSIVRSCLRPLADITSKAYATCKDSKMERLLNVRPNMYMSGHDFLLKVRTRLELLNTAFIYIERDDRNKVTSLYPVPYSYFEALEYNKKLFIKFYFSGDAVSSLTLPWDDLAAVRKDYNSSDIAGDDNQSIIGTLQLLKTVDEGLANTIKATANLRGLLKSTKAMLAPDAIREQKEQFVRDYMSLENAGGIAALDSTQEFTPIKMEPSMASEEQRKEIREDIYRFFGISEKIVLGTMTTEELENFCKIRISPFLEQLSTELTGKIYPGKAGAYEDNRIVYMFEQGEFMTMSQKLEMFSKIVLYGGMLINEWRQLMGYSPIAGGDTPIRRLDADYINVTGDPRDGNGPADDSQNNGGKKTDE